MESIPIIADGIPFPLFPDDSGCYGFWHVQHAGFVFQTVRNKEEVARSTTVREPRHRQWENRVRKATWAAGINPPSSIPLAEAVLCELTSITNSATFSRPRTWRMASRRAGYSLWPR